MSLLPFGFQGGFPKTTGALTQLTMTGSTFTYTPNSNVQLPWSNTVITGSWVNSITNTIRTNVAGLYLVSATVAMQSNNGIYYYAHIYLQNSDIVQGPAIYGNGNSISTSVCGIVNMVIGDAVGIAIGASANPNVTIQPSNINCNFYMYLLSIT